MKIGIFHLFFSWLIFSLAGVDFVYVFSFISGMMGFVHLSYYWIVCIIPCFQLITRGEFIIAIIIPAAQFLCGKIVDSVIYEEIGKSFFFFFFFFSFQQEKNKQK